MSAFPVDEMRSGGGTPPLSGSRRRLSRMEIASSLIERPMADANGSAPSEVIEAPLTSSSSPLRSLLQLTTWRIPAVLIAINLALTWYTARVTLDAFPNSGDEYAYWLQATLMRHGKLYIESPPPNIRHFFDLPHILNDGRYYGKYSPGWPLLLCLGVFVGFPWAVNGLLGAVLQGVVYWTARRHVSICAANVTLLLLTINPFFIFNSASYFTHPSCALAVAIAYLSYFEWLENPTSHGNMALLGASVGYGGLIRSFTTATLALPLAVHALWRLWQFRKRKDVLWTALSGALPLAVCSGIFLGYNDLTTGDPFLQPFLKYTAGDKPFIGSVGPAMYSEWLVEFGLVRCGELACWLPLCLPLAIAAPFLLKAGARTKAVLLMTSVLVLLLGHTFYPTHGGVRYGPRYAYETIVALTLLSATTLALLPRLELPVVLLVLLLNVFRFAQERPAIARDIVAKTDVYRLVEKERIEHALIFIRTASPYAIASDLPRNGLAFEGSVLFVRDLGDENRVLLRELPGRTPYFYDFRPGEECGRLSKMTLRQGD